MSKIVKYYGYYVHFVIAYMMAFVWLFASKPIIADQSPDPYAPYRIVFVHLGTHLPSFLSTAVLQAHLFCPNAEIILIANQQATENAFLQDFVKVIHAEKIQKTIEHEDFLRISTLDRNYRDGFWYFTTERLFYLDDLINQYDLKNTFHMENDNLIYVDLEELLPIFTNNYSGIAAPFESDHRGFGNFIFVPNKNSIHTLALHLRKHASSGLSEMFLLNSFKVEWGEKYIDHLPTIMKEYAEDHGLVNILGMRCTIDPRNGSDGPGFINDAAFFNVSFMNLIWEFDERGRRIPFAIYRDKKFRINNLHVHSKNLNSLSSLNDSR